MAGMRQPKLIWNQNRYLHGTLIPRLQRGMGRAAVFVEGEVKKEINRGQRTVAGAGGKRRGLDPSKPGEPPKKVTARLFQSVTHRVVTLGLKIIGLVGSNVKYAAALEEGASGTVKRRAHTRTISQVYGRPISPKRINVRETFVVLNLAARPYLRSTIRKHKAMIRRLILAG